MRTRILAVLLIGLVALVGANALEIGAEGLTTNLWYTWDGTATAPAVSAWPTTNWFWGGQVWLATPIGEDSSIRISYLRDAVLRNVLSATVHFEKGVARLDVGPSFGIFNSSAAPLTAGLTTAVELRWPGVAYVSVRSDGGLAIGLVQIAQPQAFTEIAAGFYVPNAIVSGLLSAKRYDEVDAAGLKVTDTLTRYELTVDIFKKNIPYTLFTSAGYEIRSKYWEASGLTDTLAALVMGIKASAIFVPGLKFTAGIDSAVYVFGQSNLSGKSPLTSSIILNATFGFAIDLDTFKIEPNPTPEPATAETPPEEQADSTKAETTDVGAEAKALTGDPASGGQAEPASASATAPKAAEKKSGPGMGFDVGTGLFYDAYPLIGGQSLSAIFNARLGVWADARFNIFPLFSIGAEAGASYFTMQMDVLGSPYSVSLLDIPLRAKLAFDLGLVQLEPFGGVMLNLYTATGTPMVFSFGIDAGARFKLMGFYAEADYLFSMTTALPSVARFGLGYALKFN